MRLLIERHNRWTIELTSSSHTNIDSTCKKDRASSRTRTLPVFTVSKLPGGTELRMNWFIPETSEPLKVSTGQVLQEDWPEPPRRRSLRHRLSQKLNHFSREHKGDQSCCHRSEMAESRLPELDTACAPGELPASLDTTAWELPADVDWGRDEGQASDLNDTCDQPYYSQMENQEPIQHPPYSIIAGPETPVHDLIPSPSENSSHQLHVFADPHYQQRYSRFFPEVSPIHHPFGGPPLSLETNTAQDAPLLTNCPSMSPSSTLTISPISAITDAGQGYLSHLHVSKQGLSDPYPGSLTGASLSTQEFSPSCMTRKDMHTLQRADTLLQVHGNSAVGSADYTWQDTTSEMADDACANIEASYFRQTQYMVKSPGTGPSLAPTHKVNKYVRLKRRALNTGTACGNGRTVLGQQEEDTSPARPARNQTQTLGSRPRETSGFETFLHQHNGCPEPLPLYSAQAPSHWEGVAAAVAQRNQHCEPSEPPSAPPRRKQAKQTKHETPPPPIRCGKCDQVFIGHYQEGNRKRHHKQKHSAVPRTFDCRYSTCSKPFKREDARRKHEWKKHRMGSKPEKRRVKDLVAPILPS